MEILMTGELYIKKVPDTVEIQPPIVSTKFGTFEIENEGDLESVLSDLRTDPDADEKEIEEIIEMYEETEELKGNNTDFSSRRSFWMSYVGEKGILMLEQTDEPEYTSKKAYRSKEDLDEDFIRLRVFLENAKYIGRNFKRTEPIYGLDAMTNEDVDTSYVNTDQLALYGNDDCILILSNNENDKSPKFSIVPYKYLDDGKYKFEGEVNNEYMDKAELYQAIFKQLTEEQKKTL